jgi:para-aminobenzoate synthetase component 1
MIVDLERNDLGRVCSYDSVKVEALRQLEEYSTVFQTTATIQGKLHKDRDRVDLLRACFPGGSITGCPKIRAMEIIEELEPSRRCIYTGCLGYLSFCGDMDFNILIRTILRKENRLYFGVGGGIVADSRPEEEYQETLVKARAIFEAIA